MEQNVEEAKKLPDDPTACVRVIPVLLFLTAEPVFRCKIPVVHRETAAEKSVTVTAFRKDMQFAGTVEFFQVQEPGDSIFALNAVILCLNGE